MKQKRYYMFVWIGLITAIVGLGLLMELSKIVFTKHEIVYYEYEGVTITRLNTIMFWELKEIKLYYGKFNLKEMKKQENYITSNAPLKTGLSGFLLFCEEDTVEFIQEIGITEKMGENHLNFKYDRYYSYRSSITEYYRWRDSIYYYPNVLYISCNVANEIKMRDKATPYSNVNASYPDNEKLINIGRLSY